jgi:hypothetical protein
MVSQVRRRGDGSRAIWGQKNPHARVRWGETGDGDAMGYALRWCTLQTLVGHHDIRRALDAALNAELLLDLCDAVEHVLKFLPVYHLITQGVHVCLDSSHARVKRLCRKFFSGGREGVVASVGGVIRRPGSRTVRPP